jgi:hypothetical protein
LLALTTTRPAIPEKRSSSRSAFGAVDLALLGYVIRIVIWFLSDGSNDIRTWRLFAQTIREAGLAETYRSQPLFNHPPIMGWWSLVALRIADWNVLTFAQAFKIPSLAAEVGTGLLLFAAWTRRGRSREASRALAAYALALNCILISAFHGNTDAVYFCLAFASAYLLESGRPFAAGAALAAAMNVKLIPVLFVLPLASRCTRWPQLRRFVAGAALGAVPFAIAIAAFTGEQARHFIDNLFRYQSNRENWGVALGVRLGVRFAGRFSAPMADAIQRSGDWYAVHGAVVLFAGVGVFAAWHAWTRWHRSRGFDAYQLEAWTCGLFLLFGSGFGVQYVGCIVAPLLAWSIWDGVAVASATGAFIGAVYVTFMLSWTPMASHHGPIPSSLIGLAVVAWSTIAVACLRMRTTPTSARQDEHADVE